MNKIIRNFIFKIILLSLILAFTGGLIFKFVLKSYYFDTFPFLIVLFPLVSTLIHIQLLKASKKSLAKFNVAFMLSFMLKIFVYAAFTGIIISAEADSKNSFVITMLLMYLIYTVFDTKAVLNDIKKLNQDS